ncbi:cyclic nucleotide-binding domain-containing protein [Marinilactibacillus kalidii]|uniref:cyclic nucleotide-binding domain-containing protein n=1 Tax=Marinilactibacillus kalidii TaxID=2820274 RepID=UPI001ABDBAEF|nr:cyclic nucleotide-binding domain-containing protein [Marinilactibacillus kalidii]
MIKLNRDDQLLKYIEKYNLQAYMDTSLAPIASLYTFNKDEHLIQTERSSEFLYFLVEGTVMIYSYSSDTQNICIDYSYPATLLGEASSLWGMTPKSNVKAMTNCVCVAISLKQYRQTLQNDVKFLQNICQILSYRLNSGVNLANSLTEPVETRLAKFILEHEENQVFSYQLTTCAVILNVSYRHLLRTITSFREANILEKHKTTYTILDYNTLEELSRTVSF